jgi:hypothetical protein
MKNIIIPKHRRTPSDDPPLTTTGTRTTDRKTLIYTRGWSFMIVIWGTAPDVNGRR